MARPLPPTTNGYKRRAADHLYIVMLTKLERDFSPDERLILNAVIKRASGDAHRGSITVHMSTRDPRAVEALRERCERTYRVLKFSSNHPKTITHDGNLLDRLP